MSFYFFLLLLSGLGKEVVGIDESFFTDWWLVLYLRKLTVYDDRTSKLLVYIATMEKDVQ